MSCSRRISSTRVTSYRGSYPAGTPTTSFGLITADGRCIPFDVSSNEKVAGMLKIKQDWDENTVKIKPTKVEVVGTEVGIGFAGGEHVPDDDGQFVGDGDDGFVLGGRVA